MNAAAKVLPFPQKETYSGSGEITQKTTHSQLIDWLKENTQYWETSSTYWKFFEFCRVKSDDSSTFNLNFIHLSQRLDEIDDRLSKIEARQAISIRIYRLNKLSLVVPMDVIIEPDGDGFLATVPDLDRYGIGETPIGAVDHLKTEIEDIYDILLEERNLTEKWLKTKEFLNRIIEMPK